MNGAALVLLDSALRASLLGLSVWLLLRLTRLSDVRAESWIWTATLAASLVMPFLTRAMPALFAVPLPSFSSATTTAPALAVSASANHISLMPATVSDRPLWRQVLAHGGLIVMLYGLIAALGLARLATGLILTARLYRSATPVSASWAEDWAVRASRDVSGPLSFGGCILLPADYQAWPDAKRIAVMAHEQSHVRRGDFFILLAASLYRALFWFNPFAWWLKARLGALAEAASDEAAARQLNDRACYAEILLEVSRHAHAMTAQLAMAKGPNITWRVDRILAGAPQRHMSGPARLAAGAAVLPAAMLIAGAHAAVPRQPVLPLLMTQPVHNALPLAVAADASQPTAKAPLPAPVAGARPRPSAAAAPRLRHKALPAAQNSPPENPPPENEVSYNPRALLDDPEAAILPAMVPTGGAKDGKKGAGAIILNLNNLAGSGD